MILHLTSPLRMCLLLVYFLLSPFSGPVLSYSLQAVTTSSQTLLHVRMYAWHKHVT